MVGIVSYGACLPHWVLSAQEIAAAQGLQQVPPLGVTQKTVPAQDEDTVTLATAAARQALQRVDSSVRSSIGALWIGSESHPYAVKPTGTVVASAVGLPNELALADLQFACKAGTQGMQIALQYVRAGQVSAALAIGADTAQSEPGDVLEYTAGAGAAAFVIGSQNVVAESLLSTSYATDTPDFWRRAGQPHPQHAGRFTGEPAYFAHITAATRQALDQAEMSIADFDHVIFHTPNGKFPRTLAKKLGAKPEQMKYSLPVDRIGNTYSAATPLALVSVLDHAKPNQTVLMCSYGSGAGADCFLWRTTPEISAFQAKSRDQLNEQIETLEPISYQQYRLWGGQHA